MSIDKVALLDLDGCIYPWVEHMSILISSAQVVQYSALELMGLHRSWNVWEDWGIPKEEFDHYWMAWVAEGIMYSGRIGDTRIEPNPGAREAMWKLKEEGWLIHIVTSRLHRQDLNEQVLTATSYWLRISGLPYDSLTFTEDKHNILGEAIVDDKIDHLIGHPAPKRYQYPSQHTQSKSGEAYEALSADDPWGDLTDRLCYDGDHV